MKRDGLHGWRLEPAEARLLQQRLAASVVRSGDGGKPRTIGGIDVSVSRFSRRGRAAVVVLRYPGMDLIDVATAEADIDFPYIPGLLSFREAPLVLEAFSKLQHKPDMIMIDGQGIAHPRRLGIACHLGLWLDIVSIGCAKSRLIGTHADPPLKRGRYRPLVDGDEIIGAVVRTKDRVKPVFVSPGHKIDLENSIKYVLSCCLGFRLPEPTRLAHMAAGGTLRTAKVLR